MAVPSTIPVKEMASREECLMSLGEFIDTCQETITSMLDTLSWTPEHFMQPKNLCVCPHNQNHRMSKCSLEKHAPVCGLMKEGYSREDVEKILEDTSYFYKDASCVYTVRPDLETVNSVVWNHHVQNHSVFYGYKKLPQTFEEEQVLMSREDRLGIAEYIIRRAKEANRLKELGQDELLVSENLADLIKKDSEERKLDPFEEMAALRDYRRRRQTYRAKNVHITKKSHTEIMREVINNQMEMYAESVREEMGPGQENTLDDENDKDSRTKRSRYSDNSGEPRDRRSRYRDDRRYSRSRSRSRERSERSFRRSRSRSRDMSYSKYDKDDQSSVDDRVARGSRDKDSSVDDRSVRESGDRSISRRENREKSKHKHKHRSRSRSHSSERYKKSKHKKHKHKHKKQKKADRRSEERDTDSVKEEPADVINDSVKKEPADETNDSVKEEPADETNDSVKKEPADETNDSVKKEPAEETNDSVKKEPSDETNDSVKKEPADESNDSVKKEPAVETED